MLGPFEPRGPWCFGSFSPAPSRSPIFATCFACSATKRRGRPSHPGPGSAPQTAAAAGVTGAALVARHEAFRVIALAAHDPEAAARAGARRLAAGADRGLVCALGGTPRRLALASWRATPASLARRPPRRRHARATHGGRPRHAGTPGTAPRRNGPGALRSAWATHSPVRPSPPASSTPSDSWFSDSPIGSALRATERNVMRWPSRRSRACCFSTSFRRRGGWTATAATCPACSSTPSPAAGTFIARPFTRCASVRSNRAVAERSTTVRALGRIPFLNGGLFEPTPLERRHGPALWRNADWRDAFDDVFERFHFLGAGKRYRCPRRPRHARPRVRRGHGPRRAANERQLLHPGVARAGDGSCRARRGPGAPPAAFPARAPSAGCTTGRRRSTHPTSGGLTLLDPAAGSGAFLLGRSGRADSPAHGHRRAGQRDVAARHHRRIALRRGPLAHRRSARGAASLARAGGRRHGLGYRGRGAAAESRRSPADRGRPARPLHPGRFTRRHTTVGRCLPHHR